MSSASDHVRLIDNDDLRKTKYAVYPVETDPKQIARGNELKMDEELEENSFWVVRDSDIFGPPLMYAYASMIQTELEIDAKYPHLKEEQKKYLEELHDLAIKRAEDWQKRGGQTLPD